MDRSLSAWPFTDPFFNTWWVARGVLKGFCRLEMCFYIKDRLFLELVVFCIKIVSRNIVEVSEIWSANAASISSDCSHRPLLY